MKMIIKDENWTELKGKINSRWTKFSESDADSMRDDFSQITAKVQTVYGVPKETAERQYEEFKTSVHSLLANDASPATKPGLSVAPNVAETSQKEKVS